MSGDGGGWRSVRSGSGGGIAVAAAEVAAAKLAQHPCRKIPH